MEKHQLSADSRRAIMIFLIGVILWIARQCWLDSKDDFKMVWEDFKTMFKKKKAD